MRTVHRNMHPFYYCLYQESVAQYDEYGNVLPEPMNIYGDPVLMYANISPASGQAQTEQYGNLESYDRLIVTTDMDCPIDEYTVLFVDKVPENLPTVTEEEETEETEETDETEPETDDEEPVEPPYEPPKYDYIVKRVSRSLNGITIAIRKVDVR